jgi:hypothetical protein
VDYFIWHSGHPVKIWRDFPSLGFLKLQFSSESSEKQLRISARTIFSDEFGDDTLCGKSPHLFRLRQISKFKRSREKRKCPFAPHKNPNERNYFEVFFQR